MARSRPVIDEFRELLEAGRFDGLEVQYRVGGGVSGRRLDQSVRISGDGSVYVVARDDLRRHPSGEGTQRLPRRELESRFSALSRWFDVMFVPEAERGDSPRGFAPDSTIASVTLRVGDRSATRHFLVSGGDERGTTTEPREPFRDVAADLAGIVESVVGRSR